MAPNGHKNQVNQYKTISEKSILLKKLKLSLYTKRHLLKLIETKKGERHTLGQDKSPGLHGLVNPHQPNIHIISLYWTALAVRSNN